ncbi:hypothetical protein [Actinomadura sp. WAC 06369]|uniref:hypothetical protein n=1 Tax=Actinomadura sp. WAC 06369 TaxID=2203193 RepID=UPI0018F4BCE5|nr:hypothetical protein [Actinomadura sp. WAC 06369]
MGVPARPMALTVPGCVLVVVGAVLLLKGLYDWSGRTDLAAARPLQGERVAVFPAAALVAAGALPLHLAGERGPALVVLVTALVPVLLVIPGISGGSMALYACLATVPVGAALALRAVLAPKTPVTVLAMLVFALVAVAGSLLLAGLADAVPFMAAFSEEEARRAAAGRLTAGLAGLALAAAPVLLLLADRKVAAGLAAPFALVALIVVLDSQTLAAWAAYLVAGPLAMGTSVHLLFTDR